MDRVAGPSKQVLVPGGYVKHFVRNMPQEDRDLGDSDQSPFSCGMVTLHRGRAIGGRGEVLCVPDHVEAGLCRAHPLRVQPVLVGEDLPVVIVLLLAEAE